MSRLAYSQLGQARENSTNAVSVYSPPADTEAIFSLMVIANNTASVAYVRIFHDDNGTTYDESTSLGWDIPIQPGSVWDREVTLCMNNNTGNFAYRSSVANALTITIYGMERI